ncbi:MAG: hypothetical protein EBZ95_12310 [Chitinophagia bacterium]|nr:hypothetical protein [Chitinophagia bacterium]
MSVMKRTKRATTKLSTFFKDLQFKNLPNIFRMDLQIKWKMHYAKMTGSFIRRYKILPIEKTLFTNLMTPKLVVSNTIIYLD